jgi:hypothetical protein
MAVGSQRVAGATVDGGENFRGPTRRSYRGAIELRQLPAAVSLSDGLIGNWTSFSASANVETVTAGPACGAVPNAGGVPGVGGDEGGDAAPAALDSDLRHAAIAAISALMVPPAARLKNPRREFDMFAVLRSRRIKAQSIIVQIPVRDLDRFVFGDFVRRHHLRQRGRQCVAR